jgi:hypothetical protein
MLPVKASSFCYYVEASTYLHIILTSIDSFWSINTLLAPPPNATVELDTYVLELTNEVEDEELY